jgi:hypothetical protein
MIKTWWGLYRLVSSCAGAVGTAWVCRALSLVTSVTLLAHLLSSLRENLEWSVGGEKALLFSGGWIQTRQSKSWCALVCWFMCVGVGVQVGHEHERTMTCVVLWFITWHADIHSTTSSHSAATGCTDLNSSANLTIATRQARLGVSHSKLVTHVSSY